MPARHYNATQMIAISEEQNTDNNGSTTTTASSNTASATNNANNAANATITTTTTTVAAASTTASALNGHKTISQQNYHHHQQQQQQSNKLKPYNGYSQQPTHMGAAAPTVPHTDGTAQTNGNHTKITTITTTTTNAAAITSTHNTQVDSAIATISTTTTTTTTQQSGSTDLVPEGSLWTALYDYEAQGEDELTLERGQVVLVLSMDPNVSGDEGWWIGKIGDKVNYIFKYDIYV